MDALAPSRIAAESRGAPLASEVVSTATANRWFLILAGTHCLIWTIVSGWTQPNAPLDVVEMVYWGNEWQWGYYKHPPLPAWIAAAVTGSFGGGIWPLYIVSQIFIISSFWVCWRMARAVIEPWSALAAVAVLEFCFFYNYVTPEFNNNIPPKLFWAVTIALLYFAVTGDFAITRAVRTSAPARGSQHWRSLALWAGTGVSIALSLLSKYDAAILVVSLLAFAVVNPRARKLWKTPGPWISILTAVAIFLPHAVWVWQSDFLTLRYFRDRSEAASSWLQHLTHPLEFVASQALSLAGVFVVLAMLFRWRFAWREVGEQQRFARNYLAFAVLGPLFVVVTYSFISGGKMKSSWGASMWTFLPLLVMLSFQFDADRVALRRLVRNAILATCIVGVLLASRNVFSPYLRCKPSRVHFPGSELAANVQRVWSQRNREPLKMVGGDAWYAGNVAVYGAGDISVYPEMVPQYAPWTSDEELQRMGGVILWPLTSEQNGADVPKQWKERFPHARASEPLVIAWRTAAKLEPLRVGVTIIDPASRESDRYAEHAGLRHRLDEGQRR